MNFKNDVPVKLKLVEGFDMPESEFIKGEAGAKGTFRKTGGVVRMFRLTFVEQNIGKSSLVFTTKNSDWNKYEDTSDELDIMIELNNDPFTGKLKAAKLVSCKPV